MSLGGGERLWKVDARGSRLKPVTGKVLERGPVNGLGGGLGRGVNLEVAAGSVRGPAVMAESVS
jgi:hypothetical protein